MLSKVPEGMAKTYSLPPLSEEGKTFVAVNSGAFALSEKYYW
jgi:hypothetical protein